MASGLQGGDTVTSMTQAYDGADAGVRSLAPTGYSVNDGNAGANYTVLLQPAAGSIVPAPLVVRADDQARPQGRPPADLTASFIGFAGTETASVLGGALVLETAASALATPGPYAITARGLTSSNYTIAFVDGVYHVLAPSFAQGLFETRLAQREARLGAPASASGPGSAAGCVRGEADGWTSGHWLQAPFGAVLPCMPQPTSGAAR